VARVAPDNRYTLHDSNGWLATVRDIDTAIVFASAFEMLDLLRRINEYGSWAFRAEVDALLVRVVLKEFPLLGGSPDERARPMTLLRKEGERPRDEAEGAESETPRQRLG